jgi:hypothetical protein
VLFLRASVFENNILLVGATVVDLDLWEATPDGLLYFELVLKNGAGNLTLNTTEGLHFLSGMCTCESELQTKPPQYFQ